MNFWRAFVLKSLKHTQTLQVPHIDHVMQNVNMTKSIIFCSKIRSKMLINNVDHILVEKFTVKISSTLKDEQ